MGFIKNTAATVGGGAIGLIYLAFMLLGVVIYVWSIIVAYLYAGLIGAIVTVFIPVIAQVFWFFKVGLNYGFMTNYCMAVIAYVGIIVIGFIGIMVFSHFSEN